MGRITGPAGPNTTTVLSVGEGPVCPRAGTANTVAVKMKIRFSFPLIFPLLKAPHIRHRGLEDQATAALYVAHRGTNFQSRVNPYDLIIGSPNSVPRLSLDRNSHAPCTVWEIIRTRRCVRIKFVPILTVFLDVAQPKPMVRARQSL